MSQEILSSAVPDEKESKGRSRSALTLTKEQQLHGVLRVMINKNRQLQTPILAAKRLAKHTQFLKDEVERLKQRAFNYENGMVRAERRAAQLQQDLYRATRNGADGTKKEGEVTKKKSQQGLPFYLPSSVQQLVDSLTTKNVALMKSLQKAVDEPHAAKILEVEICDTFTPYFCAKIPPGNFEQDFHRMLSNSNFCESFYCCKCAYLFQQFRNKYDFTAKTRRETGRETAFVFPLRIPFREVTRGNPRHFIYCNQSAKGSFYQPFFLICFEG